MTDPGTFFQTKLIRPCLDLNLQTQRMWSEHVTTELSISPLCSLTEKNEIFVLTLTFGVSSMCLSHDYGYTPLHIVMKFVIKNRGTQADYY